LLWRLSVLLAALEFYRLSKDTKAQALAVFGIIWTLLFHRHAQSGHSHRPGPYIKPRSLHPHRHYRGNVVSLILLLARRDKNNALSIGPGHLLKYCISAGSWVISWRCAGWTEAGTGYSWQYLLHSVRILLPTFVGKACGKRQLAPTISPNKPGKAPSAVWQERLPSVYCSVPTR